MEKKTQRGVVTLLGEKENTPDALRATGTIPRNEEHTAWGTEMKERTVRPPLKVVWAEKGS